jgi:hypothetical protein
MGKLGRFEGREVRGASVVIRNAGDGLSKALSITPEKFRDGEEVYFVLKGVVDFVSFPNMVKGGTDKVRRHTINTEEITRVDADAVEHLLAEARQRIEAAEEAERLAEEEAAGIQRLPVGEDD